MTGGLSGGPWLTPFTDSPGTEGTVRGPSVRSNSYGYRGDWGMYGPKFNDHTKAVYIEAQRRNTEHGRRQQLTAVVFRGSILRGTPCATRARPGPRA
ncbi:MAG: hypothetical protein ACLFRT_11110 [Actinomycetota bacterium]